MRPAEQRSVLTTRGDDCGRWKDRPWADRSGWSGQSDEETADQRWVTIDAHGVSVGGDSPATASGKPGKLCCAGFA